MPGMGAAQRQPEPMGKRAEPKDSRRAALAPAFAAARQPEAGALAEKSAGLAGKAGVA